VVGIRGNFNAAARYPVTFDGIRDRVMGLAGQRETAARDWPGIRRSRPDNGHGMSIA
jgi:hypothetical protein